MRVTVVDEDHEATPRQLDAVTVCSLLLEQQRHDLGLREESQTQKVPPQTATAPGRPWRLGLLLVVVGSTTSSATLRSAAALLQPFDKASVATTASVGGERGRKMPKLESISLLWLHEGSSHRPCSCGSVVVRWRTIAAVSGAGALVSATRAAVDIVI